MISRRYYYQRVTTGVVCDSRDGPAGWCAENPANSDTLGDYHRTVPEVMVWVYWSPRLAIETLFGLDRVPDRKETTWTVGNTSYVNPILYFIYEHYAQQSSKQYLQYWG